MNFKVLEIIIFCSKIHLDNVIMHPLSRPEGPKRCPVGGNAEGALVLFFNHIVTIYTGCVYLPEKNYVSKIGSSHHTVESHVSKLESFNSTVGPSRSV